MFTEPSIKRVERLLFSFFFLSFIIGTSIVYVFRFNGPPIRSDGVGYYAYLPSLFVHQDLSMNEFVKTYSAKSDSVLTKELGLNKIAGTNKYLDKYPMGMAVMMSPFFLMAHGSALLAHQFIPSVKPDGISSPFYHFFIAFGSSLYMLFGLIFLKKLLEPYFQRRSIYITLTFLVFATNLFHYATYDSVFSHAYSFFLFGAFLLLSRKFFRQPSLRYTLLLGITSGLIVLVRPTNGLVFLFFLIYEIHFKNFRSFIIERFLFFRKNWLLFLSIFITGVVIIFPQLVYWKYITGSWIVYSYPGESFDFAHPEILNVLFSINKGLFFWAPILLLTIPGLFLMRKSDQLRKHVFPVIIYMGCTVYLISSWWWWSYGGCYGHRGFIESLVIMAFPLAAFYEKLLFRSSVSVKRFFLSLSCLFLMLNLYLMLQYWRGYIPYDGTTWEIYISALRNLDIVHQ